MAHYQQLQFVKKLSLEFPEYFHQKSIIEMGSWNANGSVREFFSNCNYVGIDIAIGPGVDIVCQGQDVSLPDMSFDTAISCECFEHNPFWKETFKNMIRMLKPNGLCVISCATLGRKEHGTKRTNASASLTALNDADDYYHNLRKKDFIDTFSLDEVFSSYHFFLNIYSRDLYFFGFKKSTNLQSAPKIYPSILKEIKSIKRQRKTSLVSAFSKNIKFWCSFFFALMLGEKKYHNWKYKK